MSTALLTADAKNRSLRTFLVALAVDVGLAVLLVVYNAFTVANDWSQLDWTVLGFLLTKTGLTSAGAFILRRFLDPSGVPTPLPPAPVAAPADHTPEV
jgi:hypothetical protein